LSVVCPPAIVIGHSRREASKLQEGWGGAQDQGEQRGEQCADWGAWVQGAAVRRVLLEEEGKDGADGVQLVLVGWFGLRGAG